MCKKNTQRDKCQIGLYVLLSNGEIHSAYCQGNHLNSYNSNNDERYPNVGNFIGSGYQCDKSGKKLSNKITYFWAKK